MHAAPGVDAWLLPAVLALFILGPGFWVLYRLIRNREPEQARTTGQIERIVAYFAQGSPLKTQHVLVDYTFDVSGRGQPGRSVVPLRHFIHSIIPPGPVIIYDVRVNMPVLIADETRVVGDEAIEHQLLTANAKVPVLYSPSDPSRSQAAVPDGQSAERLQSPAD